MPFTLDLSYLKCQLSNLITRQLSTRFPFHATEENPKLASATALWYNTLNTMSPSIGFPDTEVSIRGRIETDMAHEGAEGHYRRNITVRGDPAGADQLKANAGKRITSMRADCWGTVNGSATYHEGLEAGVEITLGEVTSKK